MGIEEQILDAIQKQGGKIAQAVLKDLKLKSFHTIKIEMAPMTIDPPVIKVTSDKFKLKVIDKSTGDAISDIPIDLDIEVKIKPTKIEFEPITIDPKIDIMLGKQK